MSQHLEQRGLTLEQVRADALDLINHHGGRRPAVEALGIHVSAFHGLFGKAGHCGPGLLEAMYGTAGNTLRHDLPTAPPAPVSPPPTAGSADPYGGLTVHALIQSIEDTINEATGMLVTLKTLAEEHLATGNNP